MKVINSAGQILVLTGAGGGGGITNINVSAGTTSNLLSALTFNNGGGVSFGLNASTITATIATSLTNVNISAGTTSNNLSALVFSNSNNVSFGLNGSTITGTVTVASTQGSINISAGTTSNLASAFTFSNSNGISFGLNASTVTASHNGLTSQSNQQMTMFATGNTTLSSTGTSNASSLIFRGSGAASVGITNGSVLIDVAAGAAAITQSIGISTQTAGGATAGTSGYATGDDILYHFVPGSNITMSQSLNGASATLSIYGPAAGGGATLSGSDPFNLRELVTHAGANATLYLHHLPLPAAVQFDRVGVWLTHSNSSNSSGSATLSAHIGIYTRNASTLSLLSSTSATIAYTASGTAGSYSQFGSVKIWAVPWTNTLTAGNYWIGRLTRSTTGGANMTFGAMAISQAAATWSGYLGSASAATNHSWIGMGVYSATLSTLPAAISITQVNANSSIFHRQPGYAFLSNIF